VNKGHSQKDTILRGIVLFIVIFALIIGCGALAGLFTRIILFTTGHGPTEESVYGQSLTWLILLGLLLLARYYLKYGNIAKYIDSFNTVIHVLDTIAKGDYKARLKDPLNEHKSFGELAKSVNNMAADLEQLENMRQEFISNVSHEIQSPLASIRGFAQVLQSNDLLSPEEKKLYLRIIESESTRLSKLSDSLLQLAVLESKSMSLQPRPYRLDKQLRDLILACEPQWRSKKIRVEAFLDEVTCTLDEDRMSQVWINLIHNSIKFTPEGGRIRVELHQHDESMEVQLTDTGIGISAEDQHRIFERFHKADKSREHSNQGSGLGLSIAKKIVDLHGGDICVRSAPGAGTTFTVTLPN
jgi:signal transduction histidine kinase